MTPTARSLALLRRWRFQAAVVERWQTLPDGSKIRRDAFGGFDLLAVDPCEKAIWLIQATTAGNVAHRVKKLQSLPAMPDLLRAGVRCEVWGWIQRAGRWSVRRVRIEPDGLEPVEVTPKRKRARRMEQESLF